MKIKYKPLGIEADVDVQKGINNLFNNTKKSKEIKLKKAIMITSIVLFFVYGIFSLVSLSSFHFVATIIGSIQLVLATLAIFTSASYFSLFKNDYKLFLLISVLLIIPWLATAII